MRTQQEEKGLTEPGVEQSLVPCGDNGAVAPPTEAFVAPLRPLIGRHADQSKRAAAAAETDRAAFNLKQT
jgi:hypothetical protein